MIIGPNSIIMVSKFGILYYPFVRNG